MTKPEVPNIEAQLRSVEQASLERHAFELDFAKKILDADEALVAAARKRNLALRKMDEEEKSRYIQSGRYTSDLEDEEKAFKDAKNELKQILVINRKRDEQELGELPIEGDDYDVDVTYDSKGEKRTTEIKKVHLSGDQNLWQLIRAVEAEMSWHGIHNRGFEPRGFGAGQVDFKIKNDKGFSFAGKTWVTNGGHIVVGADYESLWG